MSFGWKPARRASAATSGYPTGRADDQRMALRRRQIVQVVRLCVVETVLLLGGTASERAKLLRRTTASVITHAPTGPRSATRCIMNRITSPTQHLCNGHESFAEQHASSSSYSGRRRRRHTQYRAPSRGPTPSHTILTHCALADPPFLTTYTERPLVPREHAPTNTRCQTIRVTPIGYKPSSHKIVISLRKQRGRERVNLRLHRPHLRLEIAHALSGHLSPRLDHIREVGHFLPQLVEFLRATNLSNARARR